MGGGGFSFLIALVVHGTEQAGPHSALGFFASACLYFTERLVTKRLTRLLIVPSYNTETVFFFFLFLSFFFSSVASLVVVREKTDCLDQCK